MEFRVLGSLEIWDGSNQIEISGAKRRALLALLVLQANEVVGKDRLVDELWGERAPRTAAASLHNHISRLRKALGPDRLVTRSWGYVLRVDAEQIDLRRFERLLEDAEPLPAKERSAKLAEALALWRGPALADLAFEPALEKEICRLEELRMTAVETRLDAELEAGRNAGIIPELEGLIAEHPLRERLRGQLILALYRDGRQAEALEVYRETRRLLRDELGLEPSPALRDLERAILRQDPSLAPTTRPREALDSRSPQSRWRWPRSPLVAMPVLLLLAGAGVVAAILATQGGPSSGLAAGAPLGTFTFVPQLPNSTAKSVGSVRTMTVTTVAAASESRRQPTGAGRRHLVVRRLPRHVATQSKPLGTSRRPSKVSRSKNAKPPPKPEVYWLADAFSGSGLNSALWGLAGHGTGVSVEQSNGKLQFDIAQDVVYDPSVEAVDQHYGTNCYLTGNFDAQIDFHLLDWPSDAGVLVSLGVYFAPPHEAFWSISRQGGSQPGLSEGYWFWYGDRGEWTPSPDLRGALRLTRENGLLASYYRHAGRWVKLGTGHAPGPASVILMLATHPDQFGHVAASAALDNFQATATSVHCPAGTPLPPRRRPK
jgi:DNA-binding SARP family transcriptional activator